MEKLEKLQELESLLTRLTDLPKFLGSDSKSKYKYGQKIWKKIALPALEKIYHTYWNDADNIDKFNFIQFCIDYYVFIKKAQYKKASEEAISYLTAIRTEIEAER